MSRRGCDGRMQIAPVILSKSERAELQDGLRGLPIHRLRLSGIGKDRCGQTTGSPVFFWLGPHLFGSIIVRVR
jgi:hypothetical protein